MKNRPPVDFKRLKEISLTQAVEFLSELPPPKWERGEMRFSCPACGADDRNRALAVHPTDGFTCYKQGKKSGNDATALVAHVKHISNYDAGRLLQEHFFRESPAARAPSPAQKAEPDGRREGMEPLAYLEPKHSVAELLGLSAATLEALGGGYAPRGTMAGRLLIPLRMPDGSLTGYVGIATSKEQAPLLLFPKNLEEQCVASKPAEEPKPKGAPDDLRRLFRIVA